MITSVARFITNNGKMHSEYTACFVRYQTSDVLVTQKRIHIKNKGENYAFLTFI